jgi:hypothetical protein
MEPIGSPETSISNDLTPRKNPKDGPFVFSTTPTITRRNFVFECFLHSKKPYVGRHTISSLSVYAAPAVEPSISVKGFFSEKL